MKNERLKVLGSLVKDQKRLETTANNLVLIGGKPSDELMRVKANRIQAEIDLRRAKAGK